MNFNEINIKDYWFGISDKIRFLIIGGFNAGVSFLIFSLFCFLLGESQYQASLALAWILSSIVSFVMQKYFVFNVKGNFIRQYCKCCTTWVFSYVINAVLLEIFVQNLRYNVYFSQIFATLACAVFTYILFKTFAFRRN